MSIKTVNNYLPPREKVNYYGIEKLSDIELLALIIQSGFAKKDALDLSKELIVKFNGLKGLSKCNLKDLYSIKGIKQAKGSKLLAVFEIAKRIYLNEDELNYKKEINTSKQVYELFANKIINEIKETFILVGLDSHKRLINSKIFTSDLDDKINLNAKLVLKYCVETNCKYVYLIHNHPSNCLKPSSQDINSTILLNGYLKMIGIIMIEHLIVSNKGYYEIIKSNEIKIN